MAEYELVRHCAPTLAGLKTANLFSAFYATKAELDHDIRILNRRLRVKGLRIIPFSYKDGRALIYIYRPKMLQEDLSCSLAENYLAEHGYEPLKPGLCLLKLIKRIKTGRDFPHEIGFFLGYPAEDVIGFMNNRKECKLCGCWKVYHNEQDARKTFRTFDKCTECFCCRVKEGMSISELAVAT